MSSSVFAPAAPVCAFVSCYRYTDEPSAGRTVAVPVIASPEVRLIFGLDTPFEVFEHRRARLRHLPRAVLVGPQAECVASLLVGGPSRSFAVCFRPAGYSRLFRQRVSALADDALDAADVLGHGISALHAHLCELTDPRRMTAAVDQFLIGAAGRAVRAAGPVVTAGQRLTRQHGRVSIAAIVRDSGVSRRLFEREFLNHFGMAPKRFARVSRLAFVLRLRDAEPDLTWTELGCRAGYFDQAHMDKDFRALAGVPPTHLLRSPRIPPADNSYYPSLSPGF
jgi:AraC-like DNA-binding protein